ncbi:MAG: hypothetical protein HKM05_12395 [Spirochaetales bacterium]|nr:hypothetical protein [Spirochaetales bacterium]
MKRESGTGRYLFFDLSEAAAATLESFFQQATTQLLSPHCRGPIFWLFNNRQWKEWVAETEQETPAHRFFASRPEQDRFFLPNPGGWDWASLFPDEAERDLGTLPDASLWLRTSTDIPEWCPREALIFRDEGVLWAHDNQRWLLPWGTDQGVVLKNPGQALVGDWPRGAFSPLPSHHGVRTGQWTKELTPKQKAEVLKTAELRAKPEPDRKTPLNTNQEFPGLGYRDAVDFEESLGGVRKRSLVANMQGQTELREGLLVARFVGGRLKSLTHGDTPLVTGSRSYITWGRHRHEFSTISAFSFEGDASWGLRESLVLTHEDLTEPGRLILDYFFVEDSPEFYIAASVRWPVWRKLTEIEARAVLELDTLQFSPKQALTVRSLWPQSHRDLLADRRPQSEVAQGIEFHFSAGVTLALAFPQNQLPRPYRLPWKTQTHARDRQLVLNPEGSWTRIDSRELNGWEEHFSLCLEPFSGSTPHTMTRKAAAELIPPYSILDTPHPTA